MGMQPVPVTDRQDACPTIGRVEYPSYTLPDPATLDPQQVSDIAASFQEAVVDCLVEKSLAALHRSGLNILCVGGGVAANARLRERLEAAAQEHSFALHIPPLKLCTDNAVMGAIAVEQYRAGRFAPLDLDAAPGLVRPKS
jgi:N6-L-threonylcarbamoyladenine synthase